MKKGFIKGEALRLLRTNSSETAFNDSITNFKSRLIARGYPYKMIQTTLSEVSFAGRQSALQQKAKARKQILPFVTTYHPSVCNLKNILLLNWDLIIQNQPLLNTIFQNPPILSYRRGKSLTDMLVKTKLWRLHSFTVKSRRESVQACHLSLSTVGMVSYKHKSHFEVEDLQCFQYGRKHLLVITF